MNLEETGDVLAKIQAFDNRNVDDATIRAWQEVLEPYTRHDCLAAVTGYYKSNTSWIMPGHVVERVRSLEQNRMNSFGADPRLNDHDERHGDYRMLTQTMFRAVKRGELDRATYDRYLESEASIADVLYRKAITQ